MLLLNSRTPQQWMNEWINGLFRLQSTVQNLNCVQSADKELFYMLALNILSLSLSLSLSHTHTHTHTHLHNFKSSLSPFHNITPKNETHLYLTLVLTLPLSKTSSPLKLYFFSLNLKNCWIQVGRLLFFTRNSISNVFKYTISKNF